MRFCESCGNALQTEDQFCGKCGAQVKREDAKCGKESKKRGRKNKKAWIIGISVIVVCVAISIVGVVVIKPYCEKLSDYKEAESLLKDGEYAKAYKKFEKLEDFKNAKSRQLECQYGMAEGYYKEEKFEEAKTILKGILSSFVLELPPVRFDVVCLLAVAGLLLLTEDTLPEYCLLTAPAKPAVVPVDVFVRFLLVEE